MIDCSREHLAKKVSWLKAHVTSTTSAEVQMGNGKSFRSWLIYLASSISTHFWRDLRVCFSCDHANRRGDTRAALRGRALMCVQVYLCVSDSVCGLLSFRCGIWPWLSRPPRASASGRPWWVNLPHVRWGDTAGWKCIVWQTKELTFSLNVWARPHHQKAYWRSRKWLKQKVTFKWRRDSVWRSADLPLNSCNSHRNNYTLDFAKSTFFC